jgi:amino acid transporter
VLFALLFTILNLRGIEASARMNQWMAAGLTGVVVLFLGAAIRHICASADLTAGRFLRPFFDPRTFSPAGVSGGASIAMLTYIGFDAISTLSEEARNPRRNILLATVLTCVITGILAGLQVYAAQLIWPSNRDFPDLDTAFVHIARRAGGTALFVTVNLALLVAQTGSGSGAHLAAGRLLYGMGRDDAIPSRFFAAVDLRTRIPRNNILLVGGVALAGAFAVSFELGAQLLNFGALIGFMGVNVAALARYYLRGDKKNILNLVLPITGFLICLFLWCNLSRPAKLAGLVWLSTGFLYGSWKTRGFRQSIKLFEPREERLTASEPPQVAYEENDSPC